MSVAGQSESIIKAGATRVRLRLSVMLALSIGLLVVLAVLSVLVIQVWVTHENTLDLLNEKAKFILKSVEKDIASHLDPVREQIEFIAAQIESGAYDIADKARLQILLTGALAPLPQVDRIVVLDPSLQLFAVRRDSPNGISVIELDRSKEPTSLTARDRLQSVTGAVWGDLLYFDGKTFATLQRPLRRNGEIIGYMATAISTTELSHLTEETGALLSASLDDGSDSFLATAFILYGPNNVLAHPNLTSDSSR